MPGAVKAFRAVTPMRAANHFSVARAHSVSSKARATLRIGTMASIIAPARFRQSLARSIVRVKAGPAQVTNGTAGANMGRSITGLVLNSTIQKIIAAPAARSAVAAVNLWPP